MNWTVRARRSGTFGAAVVAASLLCACPDETGLTGTLPPGALVDVFLQVDVAKVDVLFVIDDSGSMIEEQENLARNLDRFMDYMLTAKVDFHIGVTSTDVVKEPGKLRGSPTVVTPDTPNPLEALKKNVRLGVTGNAREAGLDAARRLIERRPAEFWRQDAFLFVVFLSDEDDKSEPGTPKFFYRYFEGLKGKGNERMVSAGAIVGDVPGGCSSGAGAAAPGVRYKEAVEKMGGSLGSICNPEFDVILKQMGVDAVGLRRKFALSRVPDQTTMEITVKLPCDTTEHYIGHACTRVANRCENDTYIACIARPKGTGEDGWSVESSTNTLEFSGIAIPPKGSTIEVLYFEQGQAPTP